ncbi:hypothetical protein FRC04_005786 [Tulasnella sp. 424]|nr:hypothetical protein FRC04_005786 [Tulasnella sp. 424]KAG8961912.1 hypothetical protein FRC05_005664 [Tulasnella sp. 425]
METPPSGMPSPPLSPHGTPSSLSSDFPSLEGSIYSVLAPDSPCSEPRDYHYYRHNNNVAGGGFSSHDVHHEAMRHLILPSLTLQQQREASSRALSRTASVAGFGDYGSSRQTGIAALPSVGEPSRSSVHHHAVSAIEPPENVRLLVIGRRGAGKTFLCENLVQGSVEGFAWTYEPSLGKVLSQTTPIDEKRRNGLKIVRLDGWNESDEPSQVLDSILATIQQPFRELDQVLHPTAVQSTASVNLSIDLLTSTAAPLYTAAIVVLSPHPTAIETSLLRTLSQHIPVIPFSPHQQRRRRHHSPDYFNDSRAQSRHRSHHQPQYSRHASPYRGIHSRAPSIPRFLTPISDSPRQQQAPLPNFTFHPTSHRALKEWLFDEVNLKGLRKEAAEKFLTWRERERSVEAYLPILNASRDDYTPPHNNTMHGAQFMDHIVAPVLPLDAFERFTFDQIFTPSDFESADLDSEVEAEVERESEAESRARPAAAAALPTDDEGEADVESRAQSDAEGGLLARAQYLHSDADAESESDNNNRTWEADLSRMVALRKREREHFSRMETIRPSSFHHFQSHHSLRRPLSEVVPTHTEADNLLLFHPNQNQHHLPPHHHQNDTPDYESLEHGEAGYQTASSDVCPLSSSSAFPPTTTTTSSDPNPPATSSPSEGAIDLASLDPLHIPSLLSLALSILPEIKTRIVAKIKFWILPAAFTLPRHSTDLDEKLAPGAGGGQVWDEKRGLAVVDDERENSDGRGGGGGDARPAAIMLSLPAVGAIAAAAAALGFWAGVTVDGRAGFLTLRSL